MNEGFKKIMMRQFLEKCLKAGIDPQTVDLTVYDFGSFNSVNDLIEHYANLGDVVCQKILNSEYTYSEDYIDYLEDRLNEYNEYNGERAEEDLKKVIEELKVDLDKVFVELRNLENKIINRTEWLNEKFTKKVTELEGEVDRLKYKAVSININAIEEKVRELEKRIEEKIRDIVAEARRELMDYYKSLVREIEKLDDALREEHERVSELRTEILVLKSMRQAKITQYAEEGERREEIRRPWRDYIPPPPSMPEGFYNDYRAKGKVVRYSRKIIQYGDSDDDLPTRFFKALFGVR